jgi:cardiolipin synthase (CMP-forming)
MTLPNLLSFIRLLSGPIILWALYKGYTTFACWILMVACLTDALDGYIARRWNQESALGKYLDPLADKTLMIFLLLGLYYFHKLHAFLVVAVILRDICIMIGVLSLRLQRKHFTMSPLMSSKISTVLQMVLCCTIVFDWGFVLGISPQILYYGERIVTLSTIYSFVQYMVVWWNIQKTK